MTPAYRHDMARLFSIAMELKVSTILISKEILFPIATNVKKIACFSPVL
jgi:hypothetical protein